MTLKQIKPGDWFTRKPLDYPSEKQVWIKDYYDRSSKKYICYNFSDINRTIFLKGDTVVYTDFTF